MKLRVSDDLVLGADTVVSTAGVFATKGMGKSHLAQVMAEEMLAHGQVIVAIDPTDAWYGLRSSADGKQDGYPVVVIGGDHGDLKLEPGGAVQLAEAVVTERFSCVICTDGMSDMAETKFVREFLDTIYRRNREPLHIFVDEADVFAPQKPFDVEDARCIRAMSHVVRRGRKKGLGTTLITQRPAELNASVRTMVDMLFVLGMSHNLDIDAVEKWLRLRKKKHGGNTAFALQEEMIESLDSLQRGDAWVWAPRLQIHKRFRARPKRTFDSGATPKPGQKVKAPKKLAPVDLQRLGQAMAAAVQRQKDNDPTELRKQVAALRRELERVGKGQDRAEANEKENHAENIELRVRVSVLERELAAAKKAKEKSATVKPADLRRLEALVKKIDKLVLRITGTNADLELHLSGLRAEATKLQEVAGHVVQLRGKKAVAIVGEVLDLAEEDGLPSPAMAKTKAMPQSAAPKKPAPTPTPTATKTREPSQATTPADALSKCESTLLAALAQHPRGLSRKQILIFSGYRNSGSTNRAFARLISDGFVVSFSGFLTATDRGLDKLGDYEPLPVGDELRARLLNGSSDLALVEKEILRRVCDAYPEPIDRTSARGDYANSGSTNRAFARLITMNYVKKVRGGVLAAEELFG